MKLNSKLIKEKLELHNISAISEKFGIKRETLYHIKDGHIKIFKGGDALLLKLCDFLGIERKDIYLWEE